MQPDRCPGRDGRTPARQIAVNQRDGEHGFECGVAGTGRIEAVTVPSSGYYWKGQNDAITVTMGRSTQLVLATVGVAIDPEQFYLGAPVETPPLVDRLHVRPNIEIGLGDDTTIAAFNTFRWR